MNKTNSSSKRFILFRANKVFFEEYLPKAKFWVLLYLVNYLFSIPVKYVQTVGSKNFLDEVTEHADIAKGMVWIAGLLLLPIFSSLFSNALSIYQGYIIKSIKPKIKSILCRELDKYYLSYFDDPERQNKIVRALNYIDIGGPALLNLILNILGFTASLFTLSYVSFQLDWWLAVGAILTFVIQTIVSSLSKKENYNFQKNQTLISRQINYYSAVPTSKDFLAEVRLFNCADFFIDKFQRFSKKNTRKEVLHQIRLFIWSQAQQLPHNVLMFALYFIMGTRLIDGKNTIGDYALFFSMVAQITSLLGQVRGIIQSIQDQRLQVQNYYEFITEESQRIPRNKNPFCLRKINSIEFQNVSFYYPGQQVPALKNISIRINRGEKITIVGYNGAGKSTFVKLLLSLYAPTKGNIKVNNYNADKIYLKGFWSKIGVVMQNHHTFSLTVAENILLENQSLENEARVWDVLNEVGLKAKMENSSDGLDSPISRDFDSAGINFSGGEKQKMSIARAIAKKSELLVLDEPSSALDPIAEEELYQCIERISNNKTVIMISHRLSSVQFSDRVIFFKDGQIWGDGPHDRLIESCEEYKKVFETQSKRYQKRV